MFEVVRDFVHGLNELTTYDEVLIKSTFDILYTPSLQCGVCIKKVSENVREKTKGCTGKFPIKKPVFEGVNYTICPGNFYSTAHAQLLDVHRLWRKGVMSNPGGLLDQPAKYIDVMNYVESLVSQRELEQAEKLRKKLKTNGK